MDDRHAFIIRINKTKGASKEEKREWRGQIIHVPTGKFSYIKSWNEIKNFIANYVFKSSSQSEPEEDKTEKK